MTPKADNVGRISAPGPFSEVGLRNHEVRFSPKS
jgi:hypothetical protein